MDRSAERDKTEARFAIGIVVFIIGQFLGLTARGGGWFGLGVDFLETWRMHQPKAGRCCQRKDRDARQGES